MAYENSQKNREVSASFYTLNFSIISGCPCSFSLSKKHKRLGGNQNK
jgi:hypothetical protein